MINFIVDEETCISCGQCASDCPAMIISMVNNLPIIAEELSDYCIGCMHCVAICSEGSVSILGYGPEEGIELNECILPAPSAMENLIKGRRSTRNYQDKNVRPELIDKMLEVASHAPSGHNHRELLFTVLDDKGLVHDLREKVYDKLEALIQKGELPEDLQMFSDIMIVWKEAKKDILFRNAPHLLIVSANDESASPLQDAIISLSTFELYAASNKIGTVWNGLATLAITELFPELLTELGIPEDHKVGYTMGFGHPAIWYKRTINKEPHKVNKVRKI